MTLDQLRDEWLAAKRAEKVANEQRLAIEALILEQMPAKVEGTVSDKDTGVSVTYKVTRTVDADKLKDAWMELPEPVQMAFKWAPAVDTKMLRALADVNTDAYALAATFFTSKPAKPAISIKGE